MSTDPANSTAAAAADTAAAVVAATAVVAAVATSTNASVGAATNVAAPTFFGVPIDVNNLVSHRPTPTPFRFGSTQTSLGGDGSSGHGTGSVGPTPFGSTIGSTSSGSIGSMYGHTVGAFGSNLTGYGHIPVSVPTQPPEATTTVDKPPKSSGTNFQSWRQKMFFYLTTLGYASYLTDNEPPTPAENETNFTVRATYDVRHNGDFLCKNILLGGLGDSLYKVYVDIKTSKVLWEALDRKYKLNDASTKNTCVSRYMEYKMVDSRSVIEQVQEFQLILHNVLAEGHVVSDSFTVVAVIDKLPPSWKDFKTYLKHKRKRMTFEDLIVKLRIESEEMRLDNKGKGQVEAKANLLEQGGPSNSNKRGHPNSKDKGKGKAPAHKFDGDCYNCGKPGHLAKDCRKPKKKKAKQSANIVEKDFDE